MSFKEQEIIEARKMKWSSKHKEFMETIQYNSRYLQYIERTEGMKFRRYPEVFIGKKNTSYGHNENLIRNGEIADTQVAEVYIRPSLFSAKKAPYGAIVLLHEMREILYFQNIREITEKRAHNRAFKHLEEDMNIVGTIYNLRELNTHEVFEAFG